MLAVQLLILVAGVAVFVSAFVARRRYPMTTTFHRRCALACVLLAVSTTIGALT